MAVTEEDRRLSEIVRKRLKALGVPVHRILVRLIVRLTLEVLSEQLPGVAQRMLARRRFRPRIVDHGGAARVARAMSMWRYVHRGRQPQLTDLERAAVMQLISECRVKQNHVAVAALTKVINTMC